MADAQSDADKIRNRRLAKLGGSSASGSSTPAGTSTPSQSETAPSPSSPAPAAPKMDQAAKTSPPTQNPFSQLGIKPETKKPEISNPSTIRIHSSTPQSNTPTLRARQDAHVPIEVWTDRTLSTIFRVTLNSDQKEDTHGHKLRFLEDTRQELENEEGKPLLLSVDQLDTALFEVGRNPPEGRTPCYFLGCWKRLMKQIRPLRGASADDPKMQVLQAAKFNCMSHCVWSATEPSMYEQAEHTRSPLADAMLADPECDAGLDHDFYFEAVNRLNDEDDSAAMALVGAIEQISRDLTKISMNDSFKPHVGALRNFGRYPKLAQLLTQADSFLQADVTAEKLEEDTILGPFFSLSPLQGSVAVQYFMGASARDEGFVRNSQNALQLTLRAHQEELLDIANCIIKSGKAPRERLLDWFALTVNKNHKRRAIHVDENTVSSDGFMVNVTAILDRLCEPFMDATYSKIGKIDVDYLRRSPRVNIEDETKINADQKTSDAFYANKAEGENNFISEIFFLTVAAHHYGTEAANAKLAQTKRELKHLAAEIEKFEISRNMYLNNPQRVALFDTHLKKYKDQLEKGNAVVKAIQGVLQDEISQQRSMQLMRYIIVWIMRMVSPTAADFPRKPITLPLPEHQPEVFRCLPEYFLEDIVDNFKFVTTHMPWTILSTQCEELLTMCITFLRSSEYVKNPGVKSGLVQILFYGISPYQRKPKGVLGDLLNSSDFALKHLLHALMKFYIEAESTGSHSQFYDKFNIRYEIFQIIRCIWTNPIYRKNLETESKVNHDFFVRFVNLTLNDVTFLLDESFGAFKQIHTLQEDLKEPHSLDEATKKEKEDLLTENQRKAKNWMQLTNETISMLRLFTEALADAFTSPEIVQRLADMLDYNLNSMAGDKQKELKVENPAQYHFKPLEMLNDIMSVYLHLKDKPNFLLAVARDERSYKYQTFRNAADIMQRSPLKSPAELKAYLKLLDEIEATKQAMEQEEEWLGDIPDEFLDPLLATLMEDPVILPISKNVVDRGTIRSHLLSDPHDPFNRTPLKIEDVLPDTELKKRIDAFRAEAREKAKKAIEEVKKEGGMDVDVDGTGGEAERRGSGKRKASGELEHMDTTEG